MIKYGLTFSGKRSVRQMGYSYLRLMFEVS